MYVVSYRYSVPAEARDDYLEVQRQVAERYRTAGCVRYLVLSPEDPEDDWQELSFFESKAAFERAERELFNGGGLSALFDRFVELTGQREEDLRALEFTVELEDGP